MLMRLGTALCLPSGVPFPLHAQGKAVPAPETLQRGLRSKGERKDGELGEETRGKRDDFFAFFSYLFIYLFLIWRKK